MDINLSFFFRNLAYLEAVKNITQFFFSFPMSPSACPVKITVLMDCLQPSLIQNFLFIGELKDITKELE